MTNDSDEMPLGCFAVLFVLALAATGLFAYFVTVIVHIAWRAS